MAKTTNRKLHLTIEALEDRMVPAYIEPVHVISDVAGELNRGLTAMSMRRYEEAWGCFQNVEHEAYTKHDAATELYLAGVYRELGVQTKNLRDFRHDAFFSERQAYSNAIGDAAFWTFYGYQGLRDSGAFRAEGIQMLETCVKAYDGLLMGTPAGFDMSVTKAGAVDLLYEANHERLIAGNLATRAVIDGKWVTDDGHVLVIRDGSVDVYSPVERANLTRSVATPDGLVQEGGAWNATLGTFTIHADSLFTYGDVVDMNFTFDPRHSGRMQVRDSAGHRIEVYRSWGELISMVPKPTGDPATDRLVEKLDKMSAADAAKELWSSEGGFYKYTWKQVTGALESIDSAWAAQIVLNLPTVQDRADTLTKMMADGDWGLDRAANVAWNLGAWPDTIAVLDKMAAKDVAKLIWQYSGWDQTLDALSTMTPERAGDVILNIKDVSSNGWIAVKSTLDMMQQREALRAMQVLNVLATDRVREVVKYAYKNNPADLLDRLSAKKAADVIWGFGTWKEITDALVKMQPKRIADLLWNRNYDSITNTLMEMNNVNRDWPSQVLEVMPADRVALVLTKATRYMNNPLSQTAMLNRLTPLKAAQVIRQFKTIKEMTAVLATNTVSRDAEIVKNFDPAQVKNLLNNMTVARRTAIKKALGWK